MRNIRSWTAVFLCLLLCLPIVTLCGASAEADDLIEEFVDLDDDGNEVPAELSEPQPDTSSVSAKEAFIGDIIALGEKLYIQADGRLQRAHYSGDIYVCKNFTVYLFRQNRDKYRLADWPDVQLKIPNNLPAKKCRPYSYGYCWEDIPPEEGNPFYIADQFLYDTGLSKEENRENALAFMRNVQRGDYFQMTAKYSHGTGAHSAIMISDYDPETDSVHWMDSNMAGKRIDGIRYGKVQFDAVETIGWWADAFCQKTRGATLYRLRDDLIFAGNP